MSAATSITVRVPLAVWRRPGRKTVVTPIREAGEAATPTRADPALAKAFARAHRYQRMLDGGRLGSISELAAAERIDRGYLGRLLQLTLLAPDIVEAVLDGHAPHGLGLAQLMDPFPAGWDAQRAHFDLTRPPSSETNAACSASPSAWTSAAASAASAPTGARRRSTTRVGQRARSAGRVETSGSPTT